MLCYIHFYSSLPYSDISTGRKSLKKNQKRKQKTLLSKRERFLFFHLFKQIYLVAFTVNFTVMLSLMILSPAKSWKTEPELKFTPHFVLSISNSFEAIVTSLSVTVTVAGNSIELVLPFIVRFPSTVESFTLTNSKVAVGNLDTLKK